MIKECQNPPHFTVITDNTALLDVCNLAQQKSTVSLDTEFMRVSTYFPKLGLKSYILVVKIYWFSYKNLMSFHAQ